MYYERATDSSAEDRSYVTNGEIVFTLTSEPSTVATAIERCLTPTRGKPLVVYYYPDAETAYSDDVEIRDQNRRDFSQNGAFNYDLDLAHNFTGTRKELKSIKKELVRAEIEDDISCSVFVFDNITRILNECPEGFEFIMINAPNFS
jgi:hypothetical protein